METKVELLALWQALARRAGLADAQQLGVELLACYAEPQRSYHGLEHLREIVSLLEQAEADDRLILAAWFHDAVYQPGRVDNEALSAALAVARLGGAGMPDEQVRFVETAVLATAAHDSASPETALLLDADLAILGAPWAAYARYRSGIRKEYESIPLLAFWKGRAAFLRAMLERPGIYRSPGFRKRFEQAARRNLQAELRELQCVEPERASCA